MLRRSTSSKPPSPTSRPSIGQGISPPSSCCRCISPDQRLYPDQCPQPFNGGVGQQPLNAFMHLNENALRDAAGGRRLRRRRRRRQAALRHPVILKDNIATDDMPTTAGSVALGGFASRRRTRSSPTSIRQAGGDHSRQGHADRVRQLHRARHADRLQLALRFQLFQVPGADLGKVASASIRTTRGSTPVPGGTTAGRRCTHRRLQLRPRHRGRREPRHGGHRHRDLRLDPQPVERRTSWSASSRPLGLVSRDGIVPITADQDTAGPIARTVTDAAKLLGVLAGFDEKDPATARLPEARQLLQGLHAVPRPERAEGRAHRGAQESVLQSLRPGAERGLR